MPLLPIIILSDRGVQEFLFRREEAREFKVQDARNSRWSAAAVFGDEDIARGEIEMREQMVAFLTERVFGKFMFDPGFPLRAEY